MAAVNLFYLVIQLTYYLLSFDIHQKDIHYTAAEYYSNCITPIQALRPAPMAGYFESNGLIYRPRDPVTCRTRG